ncbi:hypothetical protein NPIL_596671 [Nephila pilipes]|uniref:Uncharacterized protein n=1 Tax=Nephila pilipes TaxID=299642 RepID=A0A8X6ICU5_NEPPI|nr:hypothetical protein NPIL_596671 [Nephila pilipes]
MCWYCFVQLRAHSLSTLLRQKEDGGKVKLELQKSNVSGCKSLTNSLNEEYLISSKIPSSDSVQHGQLCNDGVLQSYTSQQQASKRNTSNLTDGYEKATKYLKNMITDTIILLPSILDEIPIIARNPILASKLDETPRELPSFSKSRAMKLSSQLSQEHLPRNLKETFVLRKKDRTENCVKNPVTLSQHHTSNVQTESFRSLSTLLRQKEDGGKVKLELQKSNVSGCKSLTNSLNEEYLISSKIPSSDSVQHGQLSNQSNTSQQQASKRNTSNLTDGFSKATKDSKDMIADTDTLVSSILDEALCIEEGTAMTLDHDVFMKSLEELPRAALVPTTVTYDEKEKLVIQSIKKDLMKMGDNCNLFQEINDMSCNLDS